jgi:ABC-2 type transport system ATP-binding protein
LRRSIGSQLQQSALPDRLRVWEALDLFAAFFPSAVDWRGLMTSWGLDPSPGAPSEGCRPVSQERTF